MGNNRKLQFAIRAALASAATMSVAPAVLAQTTSAATAPPEDTSLQEVVVTGSRIAVAPNDISITPITTVSQLEIQQSGLIRTEDILNNRR
jgi:outer membrane cobalamin receptor